MKAFNVFLCIIFICVPTICGCSPNDNWKGFIYPDKDNLTVHKFIGEFDSLESCRAQAESELEKIHALDLGDYECGLNCHQAEFGVEICKETLK